MSKYFSFLVLLFVPSSIWCETKDILDRNEWTKPFSVFVCVKMTGHNECGSGTVIYCDKDGYLVLTCYHVANPGKHGKVIIRPAAGGEEKQGEIVSDWRDHDMAVIYVKDSKHKVRAAKVAQQVSYTQGLTVCKCGYPGAGPRHVAKGTCRGLQTNGMQDWVSVHYDLLARNGDSGSGLFRESDHALIGVLWGSNFEHTGFATRVESIWKMMDSLKDAGWFVEKLILKMPPQSVLEFDR